MTTINWTYSIPRRSMSALSTERFVAGGNRMFRSITAWGPGKWGAFTLALLVPGSFVVLPVIWLVGELKGSAMNHHESSRPRAGSESVLRRLRRWWRSQDPAERYLAEATTHASSSGGYGCWSAQAVARRS